LALNHISRVAEYNFVGSGISGKKPVLVKETLGGSATDGALFASRVSGTMGGLVRTFCDPIKIIAMVRATATPKGDDVDRLIVSCRRALQCLALLSQLVLNRAFCHLGHRIGRVFAYEGVQGCPESVLFLMKQSNHIRLLPLSWGHFAHSSYRSYWLGLYSMSQVPSDSKKICLPLETSWPSAGTSCNLYPLHVVGETLVHTDLSALHVSSMTAFQALY
jgi:hypothetical protein